MVDTVPLLSRLFDNISREDGIALMNRLGATVLKVRAGDLVIREGAIKRNIGVVLDGCLEIFETDAEGRRSMVGVVRAPQSFAECFAFAAVERHPASVMAREDSRILVIPLATILPNQGETIDAVHRRFIRNLLMEICEKSWFLRSRTFILSRRSTAERLMTYLREQMWAKGSNSITIPYNRQELADFLCVDRSALSSVIGGLARRGVLTYRKNHFVLLNETVRPES